MATQAYIFERDIDRGHAWLVLAANFVVMILTHGVVVPIAIFYVIFLEEIQYTNPTQVAVATALCPAIFLAIGPLGGALINVFGCRQVGCLGGLLAGLAMALTPLARNIYYTCLMFGILGACGSGLVYLAGMAALSMHFDKHLITALSLATAGIGIGIFIFPILIQTTMRCYDWKGTLVIVGGMLLNLVACGMTFPNNTRKGWRDIPKLQPKAKPKVKSKPDRTTSDVDNMEHTLAPRTDIAEPKQRFLIAKMFTNHHYVLLCVNSLCAIFGQSVVYTHLVAYSQSLGISEYKSALLISTIGVCNIIGRLLFVIVERLTKWNALIFHIFSYITAGIFIILIPLSDNYIWLHFCGGIFGAMSSTLGNMVPAIIVDFLGPSLMANGFGNLMLFEAVGQTLGGPLASVLYQNSRVYASSMYLGGAVMIAASALLLPSLILRHKPRKFTPDQDSNSIECDGRKNSQGEANMVGRK